MTPVKPDKSDYTRHQKQQGSALLMVLWVALFASVILAITLATIRTQSSITRAAENRFHAKLAGEAVLALYIDDLQSGKLTRESLPYAKDFGKFKVSLEISEAYQLTDLNLATEAEISVTFVSAGLKNDVAKNLAAEIADWRDADDIARLNGAERREYSGSNKKPANRPYSSVEELQFLRSMTEEIYSCIKRRFTIFGGRTRHSNAASSQMELRPGDRQGLRIVVSLIADPNRVILSNTVQFRVTGTKDIPIEILSFSPNNHSGEHKEECRN